MLTFSQFNEKFDAKLDYHDELNPALWEDEHLKPKVRFALQKIAQEFQQHLKIDPADIVNVILTGSNANFNWTKLSDIDLHVVVDFDRLSGRCKGIDADEYLQAKKTIWNDHHHILIYGYHVEVYAQHSDQHISSSAGIYNIQNDEWIRKPTHERVNFNDESIALKAEDIMNDIDDAINNKVDDMDALRKIKERILTMRRAGLLAGGEYSIENLAFKALRNNGYLEKFSQYISSLVDKTLSLEQSF